MSVMLLGSGGGGGGGRGRGGGGILSRVRATAGRIVNRIRGR